jgi:magnesium chelatase family protein
VGDAIENLGLTGRGLDRLLRVARTIADLDGELEVRGDHLGKALSFRLQKGGAGVAA